MRRPPAPPPAPDFLHANLYSALYTSDGDARPSSPCVPCPGLRVPVSSGEARPARPDASPPGPASNPGNDQLLTAAIAAATSERQLLRYAPLETPVAVGPAGLRRRRRPAGADATYDFDDHSLVESKFRTLDARFGFSHDMAATAANKKARSFSSIAAPAQQFNHQHHMCWGNLPWSDPAFYREILCKFLADQRLAPADSAGVFLAPAWLVPKVPELRTLDLIGSYPAGSHRLQRDVC